jgi:Plant protein 1589 of unknown function (A_thal_3526)
VVQRHIEQCIRYFLNKEETIELIRVQANVDPEFTAQGISLPQLQNISYPLAVWHKLEQQYPDFFATYSLKRRIADQILVSNPLAASVTKIS